MFNPQNNRQWPRRRFFFILFPIAAVLIFSAVVMLLWNAVLPDLVPVNRISYSQAAGLLILCRILFGGFRSGGRRRFGPPGRIREKWMAMNSAEKEQFKEEWKKRCEQRKP